MKFLGFEFGTKSVPGDGRPVEEILQRIEASAMTGSGVTVTPENCEESPTVQAIVNAISMKIATLPVHVYRKWTSNGRESKEQLPNHPVARLLSAPNEWQTPTSFWLDATSALVRHGNFCAVKLRGVTGPIRQLVPIHPTAVRAEKDDDNIVEFYVRLHSGEERRYELSELMHARGRAKNFIWGDSPVWQCREAIALEIAAQKFGASYFGNGAMPGLIFSYMEGIKGHMTGEARQRFLESLNATYGKIGRFKSMVLPAGMKEPTQLTIENDKAQFLETRKLQRNVIAGAFGIPPHLVGDLERATFSNVEHQSAEFQEKVVLPYVRMFESAMERSLLTDEDRRGGVVIRFNLDAAMRADFKSRQEGLKVQREAGVISPNEWREREGMNPIPAEQGGDTYWLQGPSGQSGANPNDDTDPELRA